MIKLLINFQYCVIIDIVNNISSLLFRLPVYTYIKNAQNKTTRRQFTN